MSKPSLEMIAFTARQVVQTDQPEFSGTAAPGSIIRISLSPGQTMGSCDRWKTEADETGQWSLTTARPLTMDSTASLCRPSPVRCTPDRD